MEILKILKTTNKDDLRELKIPLIALFSFIILSLVLFPKPSKIYRDGVLKTCKCFGIKASPRMTRGSLIGDEYCAGIPFSCEKQELLKK